MSDGKTNGRLIVAMSEAERIALLCYLSAYAPDAFRGGIDQVRSNHTCVVTCRTPCPFDDDDPRGWQG